jgi:hypothetical protein
MADPLSLLGCTARCLGLCRAIPGLTALAVCIMAVPALRADDALLLREAYPPGYQYHVSCRVELSGALTLPPEKGDAKSKSLPVTGNSAIEYDERILRRDKEGTVQRTARIYRRIEFQRKVGDRLQETTIRKQVRRLVVLRNKNVEVPFSPDGPLMWGEIDLVRTDVFTPALAGLLPRQTVRPGDRWTAVASAIQELTDMDQIKGSVTCKFEQVTTLSRRRHVRIGFSGTVSGTNEDGPNRQRLEGYFFFDLESAHISYLYLKGTHFLLDKNGKEQGRIVGHFTLTRQANRRSIDLSDRALQGVTLEPNDDNTLLLYDNTELGVRLLHPRRWRVAGVHGRQVALDEARGNGLLLTLEPSAQVPTAAQFLQESRSWLAKQKSTIRRIEAPRRLQNAPYILDRFALDTEMNRQRVLLEYYVVRQARGGATIAARLLPADQSKARQDAERIARSVRITNTVVGDKKK